MAEKENQEFKTIDDVKKAFIQMQELCAKQDKLEIAGMGALRPFASAIVKIVDEINDLKKRLICTD